MFFIKTEVTYMSSQEEMMVVEINKAIKITVVRAAKFHYEPHSVLSVLNMLMYSILSIFL